ncbi:hypothetical protein HPT25_10300 [Bacillus sp. BRMEA1]|uniref:hypothetical protein n=1 Tax=Neobacillus endophyticus TaxID=2738405 RepID=UPI001567C1EF|nr:hypothetical protein [Neobacillus endophyticus]NRD77804.1 hypothetical protein [Neobacillus endophyticus]
MLIHQANVSDKIPEKAKQLLTKHSEENSIEKLVPFFIKEQEIREFCEGNPTRLLNCYFSVITEVMLQEGIPVEIAGERMSTF